MKKLLSPFEKESKIIHRTGGETLVEIAIKYRTTPKKIIRLNCLDRPPERGTLLYVERGVNRLYIVRPEDDLQKISARTGVAESDLLSLNAPEDIFPYSIIEVPKRWFFAAGGATEGVSATIYKNTEYADNRPIDELFDKISCFTQVKN